MSSPRRRTRAKARNPIEQLKASWKGPFTAEVSWRAVQDTVRDERPARRFELVGVAEEQRDLLRPLDLSQNSYGRLCTWLFEHGSDSLPIT